MIIRYAAEKKISTNYILNMNQLSDLMEPHVGMVNDLEQQIRRPLGAVDIHK